MGQVVQKFTGDSRGLEQAYEKLVRSNVKLEEQNRKLSDQSKRGNQIARGGLREQDDLTGRVISRVGALAGSWLSVQSAITLAREAFEQYERLQAEAKGTQQTVGQSQAAVLQNLSGETTEAKRQFLDDIKAVQARTRFPDIKALNAAAASGVSASAGDLPGTLAAMEASARLSRADAAEIEDFVGGALDMRKASGLDDARANLGLLLTAGTASRVTNLGMQARNIAPAALSAVATAPEQDPREAAIEGGRLFAALSTAAVDLEGRATRTAQIQFLTQLREFFKDETIVPAGQDPGTIQGRIQYLQQRPELSAQFLSSTTREQQFKVAIEQLVQGIGVSSREFAASKGKVEFDVSAFERTARDLENLTPELQREYTRARTEAAKQQLELRQTLAGRTSQAREIQQQTLDKLGVMSAMTAPERAKFEAAVVSGVAPEEAAIRVLEDIRDTLKDKSEPSAPLMLVAKMLSSHPLLPNMDVLNQMRLITGRATPEREQFIEEQIATLRDQQRAAEAQPQENQQGEASPQLRPAVPDLRYLPDIKPTVTRKPDGEIETDLRWVMLQKKQREQDPPVKLAGDPFDAKGHGMALPLAPLMPIPGVAEAVDRLRRPIKQFEKAIEGPVEPRQIVQRERVEIRRQDNVERERIERQQVERHIVRDPDPAARDGRPVVIRPPEPAAAPAADPELRGIFKQIMADRPQRGADGRIVPRPLPLPEDHRRLEPVPDAAAPPEVNVKVEAAPQDNERVVQVLERIEANQRRQPGRPARVQGQRAAAAELGKHRER